MVTDGHACLSGVIFSISRCLLAKSETAGSAAGSVVSLVSEHLYLNGAPKIFFNILGSSLASEKNKDFHS